MNHDAAQGRKLTLCGQGAEDSCGQDVETPCDRDAETPCGQHVEGPQAGHMHLSWAEERAKPSDPALAPPYLT